jgi:hypothetical protein
LGSFCAFAPTELGLFYTMDSLTPARLPNWLCFALHTSNFKLLPIGFVLRIWPSGTPADRPIGFVSHNRLGLGTLE